MLAAEVAQRDSAERTVGDSADHRARDPAHDAGHHPAQHRARHRARSSQPSRHWDFRLVALRVLAPAAAVVVLAAGGYGLSRIGSGSTSSVAAGSAAASASSPEQAQAGAAVPSSAATSRPEAAPLEPAARFGVVTSTTNYLRATLPQQLKRELQRYARPAAGNEQSVQELAPGPVKECVLRVTAGISPVSLVLVEQAYYQGQPANVIVAVSGDQRAAWVTTPTCSAGSDYVLAMTTLPGTSAP
jgi:hypothetical protein